MTPHAPSRRAARIEWRSSGQVTVLSRKVVPLAPLAAELEALGETGELVLVDDEDERDLIRWSLGRPIDPPRSASALGHSRAAS